MTALPVREMTEPKPKHIEKPTSPPNAAQAPQENSTEENSSDDSAEIAQDEQEILSADTYRWEWSNPELAKADIGVRPSDIKQAILKILRLNYV